MDFFWGKGGEGESTSSMTKWRIGIFFLFGGFFGGGGGRVLDSFIYALCEWIDRYLIYLLHSPIRPSVRNQFFLTTIFFSLCPESTYLH